MAASLRPEAAFEAELQRAAAFRTALRRFLRRSEAVAAQAGLTAQRYDLLLMISTAGGGHGLRVSELCELLQMQQSAVSELVKRAEEAGLIERSGSPQDGRVSLLRLSREGERRMLDVFHSLREDRAAFAAVFREVDTRFRAASR